MLKINELRENRAKAWEAAKNFLDTHQTEKGTLSAEDAATYDRMEAEVVSLGKEIGRMERREALDAGETSYELQYSVKCRRSLLSTRIEE